MRPDTFWAPFYCGHYGRRRSVPSRGRHPPRDSLALPPLRQRQIMDGKKAKRRSRDEDWEPDRDEAAEWCRLAAAEAALQREAEREEKRRAEEWKRGAPARAAAEAARQVAHRAQCAAQLAEERARDRVARSEQLWQELRVEPRSAGADCTRSSSPAVDSLGPLQRLGIFLTLALCEDNNEHLVDALDALPLVLLAQLACVSRGWRTAAASPRLHARLDFRFIADHVCTPDFVATRLAAAAGGLRVVNLQPLYADHALEPLLRAAPAAVATLRELALPELTGHVQGGEVYAWLRALPSLQRVSFKLTVRLDHAPAELRALPASAVVELHVEPHRFYGEAHVTALCDALQNSTAVRVLDLSYRRRHFGAGKGCGQGNGQAPFASAELARLVAVVARSRSIEQFVLPTGCRHYLDDDDGALLHALADAVRADNGLKKLDLRGMLDERATVLVRAAARERPSPHAGSARLELILDRWS